MIRQMTGSVSVARPMAAQTPATTRSAGSRESGWGWMVAVAVSVMTSTMLPQLAPHIGDRP